MFDVPLVIERAIRDVEAFQVLPYLIVCPVYYRVYA